MPFPKAKNYPPIASIDFESGNTFFVDPAGNDANSGKSSQDPRLTITSGLTLLSAGDALAVAAGAYTESFTVSDGFTLDAFSAEVTGTVTYGDDTHIRVREINATTGQVALVKSGTGDSWIDVDHIDCTGSGSALIDITAGSDTYLECKKISLVSGLGIGSAVAAGHVHVNVAGIYASGATAGCLIVGAGGEIKARLDTLVAASGVAINVAGAGAIYCSASQEIIGALNVATGGTLFIQAHEITGDATLAGTGTMFSIGNVTGDVTLTGTSEWDHHGNVVGDIDCGDGCIVEVWGDVTGDMDTTSTGSIIIHGRWLGGTLTGTGTFRVVSDRTLGMWSGLGTTYVTGDTPVAHTTAMVTPIILNGAAGVVELDLVTAAAWIAANPDIPFVRVTAIDVSNACTIDPNGTEQINGAGAGVVFTFGAAYDSVDLYPISGTGWVIR